jgi:hypothetical protein
MSMGNIAKPLNVKSLQGSMPVTLPMLRAACAIAGARVPFVGRSFPVKRAGKTIFFTLQVMDALERRGLARVFTRRTRPTGRARYQVTGVRLTPAGERLVRYTPALCIGCGCTDAHACPEGCAWVAPGWCSQCDLGVN